ncbi:MAG: flagellar motor protein MotA [Alphaproteobacteria bacterium]|jgi:hypothetical protein|nr:flagellar motor protein MotA [Alphaproteobacteria bacterium]MBT5859916.1 flagellar motor protein MotA [Alphaproteobacteria bacterium]
MTSPRRYLTRMVAFTLVVVILAGALFTAAPVLTAAFDANRGLNGLILGMLVVGIFFTIRQVQRLGPEVQWIESYRRSETGMSVRRPPVLLAPMATMLGERAGGRASLSTMSMTSILDSISSRLDESRETSRYLTGLLIFLGLLGTFWGLLETIGSVSGVIEGLSATSDTAGLFGDLIDGLQAPMAGMGTAFSSSLFGLAGALVLGFLDLQTGQAQNRFYNDLEEWLSSITRLSSGLGSVSGGDQSVPAYVAALLEQTAESLDTLQRTISRGEEGRTSANSALLSLADRLATLTDQMRAEQDLMVKLVESQMEIRPVLKQLGDSLGQDRTITLDDASRSHLRNLDVYVTRLSEDSISGRDQMIEELRREFKLLARTLAGLNIDGRQSGKE